MENTEILKKIGFTRHPVTYKKKYVVRDDAGIKGFHQAVESLVEDGRITIAVLCGVITSIADDGQLTPDQLQLVEHMEPAIEKKWKFKVSAKPPVDGSVTISMKLFPADE